MKKGLVIKNATNKVMDNELELINRYTRRELSGDEVYVFSVVLCDNDIDRDFERFTVESLFELKELFVGKTGIFDHTPSAKNQVARIFSCEVESIDNKKTLTGDDYFRLTAKAYIPRCDSTKDIIMSIDSGIIKEVSVGCAVKNTVCSICSNSINSVSCAHKKGETYNSKLCYGELIDPLDAYEFSFVAVPAQKNAGIIKSYFCDKENENMKDLLSALKKGEGLSLKSHQCESLCGYIAELESQANDGRMYRESLKNSVIKMMGVHDVNVPMDTIKSIVEKLSVSELIALIDAYESKKPTNTFTGVQLCRENDERMSKNTDKNNQFTI